MEPTAPRVGSRKRRILPQRTRLRRSAANGRDTRSAIRYTPLRTPAVSLRRATHRLLESDTDPSRFAHLVRLGIAAIIVGNVVALVVETVPDVHRQAPHLFHGVERTAVAVFVVEYVLRLWSIPEDPRHARPIVGRLRWMVTPMAVIDLVSILPALLATTKIDLRAMRLLRLLRILRIVKLGRYSVAARTLTNVLRAKAADLLSLLALLVMMLLISSTMMFFFENEAQPTVFSSIPATMWWGIVTLTTIGYGDMTPVTLPGRLLGSVIAVVGIGMFALPAGLLGAAFVEELGKARKARADAASTPRTCPHCGGSLAPHEEHASAADGPAVDDARRPHAG